MDTMEMFTTEFSHPPLEKPTNCSQITCTHTHTHPHPTLRFPKCTTIKESLFFFILWTNVCEHSVLSLNKTHKKIICQNDMGQIFLFN